MQLNAGPDANTEVEQLTKQKAEDERLAQVKAESESKAKQESDRLAVERAEADRKAKTEVERLTKQKAEDMRLAQVKAESESKAKQESDRFAVEKAEADRKAKTEVERLTKQKAEDMRLAQVKAESEHKAKQESVLTTAIKKKPATKGFVIGVVGIVSIVVIVVLCIVGIGAISRSATPIASTITSESAGGVPDVESEFALPDGATNIQDMGGSINFQVKMNKDEAMKFYMDSFTSSGYTERAILTVTSETTFSMVFDGHESGKAIVIQGVDLGDGTVNINIRLEDV